MKKALDFFGGDDLRARIFWEKYALRDEKGNVLEETPEDMWRRILAALGLNDNPDFLWLLSDFRFVPGGRILHAVGNEFQKCTCYNCYLIPIKDDSIEAIYECAKEMARTYSYGGGVGCVAKGSYVITRNGVKRIEEVQEGEEVLSYNPTLQQPEFRQVLKVHRPIVKRKDNIAIYLKDGTRIVTSRWHPTLAFRENKFQYIPAAEVRQGDAMVATPQLHALPLNCERLHNPEIAWWVGAHLGDGSASKCKGTKHTYILDYKGRGKERQSTRLRFYNRCKEVAQEYARIYNKYTNSEVCVHLSPRGLYEVTTSSYKAGDIIDKYADGIYGKKALRTKIPRWIWNASRESQLAFLAGLIDTDGHINASASRLEFYTSSKEFAYGLKTLLALLGARAWIKVKGRNHQGRNSVVQRCEPSYSVCLPALPIVKEIARYIVNPERKKRLMNMRFPHNNRDIVAVPPVVQHFLEQYAQRKIVGLSRYRLLAGLKKRGWVNRKLFLRVIDAIIEKTQDPNVYYQALAFRHLCLSLIPVEKVVPEVDVDEEFCDLTVEGNNNYFAGEGGLTVIHNTDISILRPAGAEVRNTARHSTGAVSFMELYSLTTGTIGQHFRRGALMITIEDWHPDVLDFVKIKRNLTKVRYANISVKISDDFMEAVKRGRKWWLRFEGEGFKVEKKIDARELMDEIVKSAHGWAEPGIIYWSTMKRNSNSEYFHPLLGTNPCSEIGLPAYGACNLAAINLYKFVKNPFTEHAYFDFEEFKKAVRLGVRFLDAVIDYADAKNKYPLEAQRETENRERRLGLGIMGLADMFFALGLKYDSEEAVEFAEKVFTVMRDTAYDESVNLAIEKGPFPAFNWEGYSQSEFIKRLPRQLKERIKKHGIRNVALLTVAPTGSIGTMSGVSTGIEPIFQVKYYRRSESLSQKEFEVFHPTVNDYFKVTGKKELPPHLVTAHEIDPIMRVEMQATIQTFVDNAISSCLTRNNLILTDKGFRYIDTICSERREGEFVPIKDLRVINAYGLSPATHFYYNGVKPVYRIELEGHYYIEGTANHKVLTLTKDYELVWRRLDEIQEGEFVVMRKGLNKWGNIHELSKIYGKPFTTERKTNAKEIKIPQRITRPLARFLGYLLSDGSVLSNGNTISFTQQKGEILEDFCRLAKEIFGIEPQIVPDPRSPNLYNAKIHSRTLVRFLEYLGAAYQGTEKRTPLCILSAGREIVKEFIRGLTLDGYVSRFIGGNPIIVPLCNRSEYLIREVQQLLLNFGIESNIFNAPYEVNDFRHVHGRIYHHEKRDLYHLYVTGEDARRFVEMIGFAETRKNEGARQYLERKSRPARQLLGGLVPTNNRIYEMLREGLKKIKSNMLYEKIHSIASQIRSHEVVGRDVLAFACESLNLLHELPTYLLDPTYTFKRVKNKTLLPPTETFDLSVPQGHHYIANGIVSHNTVNLPRDISPKAVEDIYFEAWKRGCKGITVYREGSREDILRVEKEKSEPKRARFVRPASLSAEVFKYRTEAGNVYITISKDNEGKPREVFINIGKSGSTTAALGEALGRILSISLQYDVPPEELIQQLRLIRSGSWERQPDGTVVFSVPDAVGRALAKACGEENNGNHLIVEEVKKEKPDESPQIDGMTCPECGGIMVRLGGCSACVSCSYTRCD